MSSELMRILGTIAAVVGSMVIYIFPDFSGMFDDISAISMIFVYLNRLVVIHKHHSRKVINKLTQIYMKRQHML